MLTPRTIVFAVATLMVSQLFAAQIITGIKRANPGESFEKNLSGVHTKALLPEPQDFKGGMNEFLPFIMPSPDQENAGSCLFMSHTAVSEVLINRERQNAGKDNVDLSERYLMNLSKANIGDDLIKDWKTDTIYRFNKTGRTYTNNNFPYIKGWYKTGPNGLRVFANEGEPGAYYGVRANWVIALDELKKKPYIKTPQFSRNVLFADPKGNRWNVATAPEDIVYKVKKALDKKTGPVLVIYNHTGFWHAVMVAGYNDNVSNANCPFVSEFPVKMNARADEIEADAASQSDPKESRRLYRKAKLFRKRADQVQNSYQQAGGCSGKGVFYVRDSIYPHPSMPDYDYDSNRIGEEKPLTPPVILREYDWLRHLSNHVIHITNAR